MTVADNFRRITAADVAREVGVSRATVGFVLNDTPGQTISEATKDRVIDAARRLGYRPHLAAQSLRSGRSRIILVVLPDWPLDYSMNRHLEEAAHVLDEQGYSMVTTTLWERGRSRPLWETLQPDVVMGLVPFSPERYDEIIASGVREVTPARNVTQADLDRGLFGQGPSLQVEHLRDRGRHRLAFAATSDPRLQDLVASRHRVAEKAAAAAGLPALEFAAIDEGSASETVRRWIDSGIDGVVGYNDDVAAAVIGAALRAGVRVPDDLAVIGHDDSPLARLLVPSLSSVHVDNEGIGRFFAEIALSSAEGIEAPPLEHQPRLTVVARESTSRSSDG